MAEAEVKHIVIFGDTTASVAAAAIAISLQGSETKITLIRSNDDDPAAPIELSRGGLRNFHSLLGIDEQTLMTKTGGVFELGTRYRGFRADNTDVFVPLGGHSMTLRLVDFHHYVAKLRADGNGEDYNDYSLPAIAAATAHFVPPGISENPVQKTVEYDIRFDRDLYSSSMIKIAADLGVTVIKATLETVDFCEDGAIAALVLAGGNRVAGDFFIDCSDNRALSGRLSTTNDFQDWSDCLPGDRVASVRVKSTVSPDLFTTIDANGHGWVRRSMLDNAVVSSFVYSSQHTSDEVAKRFLEKDIYGASGSDVQVITQRAGSYKTHWVKNCVVIGPAAEISAPMEISSMQLAQRSILRLLAMLPRKKDSAMLSTEFNRAIGPERGSFLGCYR